MNQNGYRYAVELTRMDGSALGQFPVMVDWEPARECARFAAFRRGLLPSIESARITAIEPVWHPKMGEPYLESVCIKVSSNGAAEASTTTSITYFKSLAQESATALVEKKVLKAGEQFHYAVLAFPARALSMEKPKRSFSVEEVATSLPLRESCLAGFKDTAMLLGEHAEGDVAVFIPQEVLDEAEALTVKAGENETGGILIGHVHRDSSVSDLFVEITAQIPVKYAVQEKTKLTFTAETWTAVQAAIDLRRNAELMLSWWHSHPAKYWCNPKCPPEARKNCPLTRAPSFFSADDCALHRTVFSRAYHTALVVTVTDDGLRHAMFGWRDGIITQRGFHVTHSNQQGVRPLMADAAATIGEKEHETPCPN